MNDDVSAENLDRRFGIPDRLRFTDGSGNLVKAFLRSPLCDAEFYLHGAHVTSYQPAGQPHDLLFMSGKSQFDAGKAIRGGVPICFPWFGNLSGHPEAPAHGFARTSLWAIKSVTTLDDGAIAVELALSRKADPASPWPHAVEALYQISFGRSLRLSLTIINPGPAAFSFEAALHSYFSVSDVRQASVTGLAGTTYLDKLQANKPLVQGHDPILIKSETDRIYQDTTSTCTITDPLWRRQITVAKTGSQDTVVWNPWIAKAKAMADFGDEEWPGMLCIETCNVQKNSITLQPGKRVTITAEIQQQATA